MLQLGLSGQSLGVVTRLAQPAGQGCGRGGLQAQGGGFTLQADARVGPEFRQAFLQPLGSIGAGDDSRFLQALGLSLQLPHALTLVVEQGLAGRCLLPGAQCRGKGQHPQRGQAQHPDADTEQPLLTRVAPGPDGLPAAAHLRVQGVWAHGLACAWAVINQPSPWARQA